MTDILLWTLFALIFAFAILVSIVRGVLTHTSAAEVEALKQKNLRAAKILDRARDPKTDLISVLGVLYSSAAGLSAALAGTLAGWRLMGYHDEVGQLEWWIWPLGIFGAVLAALLVTVFTGLAPRKLGGHSRHFWQPRLIGLTAFFLAVTQPLRRLATQLDHFAPPPDGSVDSSDEEIRAIVQRNLREGRFSEEESLLVANAVRLDDITVRELMTPRMVLTAIEAELSVGGVFHQLPNLPHGRFPVYEDSLDHVIGIVRRRDLLQAKASGQDNVLVRTLADKAHFIPESAIVGVTLRDLVKTHQRIAIVVDEFGNVSGVITLEDIFEYLIGAEIFEKDDVAVNMRDLARARARHPKPSRKKNSSSEPHFP